MGLPPFLLPNGYWEIARSDTAEEELYYFRYTLSLLLQLHSIQIFLMLSELFPFADLVSSGKSNYIYTVQDTFPGGMKGW